MLKRIQRDKVIHVHFTACSMCKRVFNSAHHVAFCSLKCELEHELLVNLKFEEFLRNGERWGR